MTGAATSRYGPNLEPPLSAGEACHGECEATGYIPVHKHEKDPELARRWQEASERNGTPALEWQFVICPTCEGTGRHAKEPTS